MIAVRGGLTAPGAVRQPETAMGVALLEGVTGRWPAGGGSEPDVLKGPFLSLNVLKASFSTLADTSLAPPVTSAPTT
jgi:hypothetical protein